LNSIASAILSSLSSNRLSRYAMTAPQAEQQINDILKSSTTIDSKVVASHFGHLGLDIFSLRGFDISAQAGRPVSLFHYTTVSAGCTGFIRVEGFNTPPNRRFELAAGFVIQSRTALRSQPAYCPAGRLRLWLNGRESQSRGRRCRLGAGCRRLPPPAGRRNLRFRRQG